MSALGESSSIRPTQQGTASSSSQKTLLELPSNLSFITKTGFHQYLLSGTAAAAALLVAGFIIRDDLKLPLAALTLCLTTIGTLYVPLKNEPETKLKTGLANFKKDYTYDTFKTEQLEFAQDLLTILDEATNELSHFLPENWSQTTVSFVSDQLATFFPLNKKFEDKDKNQAIYNKTMDKILDQLQVRIADIRTNIPIIQSHIKRDKALLHQKFFPSYPGTLDSFTFKFSGDETHSKGQRVCFIIFNGDSQLQLVYKPRNISVDKVIIDRENSLVSLINKLAERELIATHLLLDKESYGYAEFLSHTPQEAHLTLSEMQEYYTAIGRIQAFAQVFGIRDLHQDNMIAHSKKPYLIDLEVAFNMISLLSTSETELIDSVLHVSRSDKNHVRLLDPSLKDALPISTHFHENKTIYLQAVQKGFEEMKSYLVQHKDVLKQSVRALPDTLKMRFVPTMTSTFHHILNYTQLLNQSQAFMDTINDARYITPLRSIKRLQETDTDQDVLHHDVPFFQMDFKGNVYYQEKVYWSADQFSKALIESSLDKSLDLQIQSMFVERFKKAIIIVDE